jgi:hypothetical protein
LFKSPAHEQLIIERVVLLGDQRPGLALLWNDRARDGFFPPLPACPAKFCEWRLFSCAQCRRLLAWGKGEITSSDNQEVAVG